MNDVTELMHILNLRIDNKSDKILYVFMNRQRLNYFKTYNWDKKDILMTSHDILHTDSLVGCRYKDYRFIP